MVTGDPTKPVDNEISNSLTQGISWLATKDLPVLGTDINAQLECHVESGQIPRLECFDPRYIVNAEFGLTNNASDFLDPNLAAG